MYYEEMRQWRDITEFLLSRYYRFVPADDISITTKFQFLHLSHKSYRHYLWNNYMLQICQFSPDPYSFYHRMRSRDIEWGWRLLPDHEEKIHFLEQVTLFGKDPIDVPQPWKARIWEKFLNKSSALGGKYLFYEGGDCPIKFDCKSMSGAADVISCPNKLKCKQLQRSL